MQLVPRPFGAVLGDAMNSLARVWRPLLSTSLLVFIPAAILSLFIFGSTGALDFLELVLNDPESLETMTRDEFFDLARPFFSAAGISVAIQSLASVFVYLASHRLVAADVSGNPISAREARREAARRFVPALASILVVLALVAILLALGLALWLIPFVLVGTPNAASILVAVVLLVAVAAPSIWLSIAFSMVTSVVAIERSGPIDSLRRSFRLVRHRWWPTLGYVLLVGLIGSVAAQLIQILAVPLTVIDTATSGLALASLLGVVFQGLIIAGIAAMYTSWYLDLRARAEDLSSDDLR